MAESDDLSGDDPEFEELADEFERHRVALYERISGYMEEADVDDSTAVHLLIDAAIGMRMAVYGFGVEKPSAGGLKLDLDRLRGEFDEFVRESKKGAEEFIARVKEERAAAEEEGEECGENGENERE